MTASTEVPRRLWASDVAARGLKRDAAIEISHAYERLLDDVPLAELKRACMQEFARGERFRRATAGRPSRRRPVPKGLPA